MSVFGCWVESWAYWLVLRSLSGIWLSVKGAAGYMACFFLGLQRQYKYGQCQKRTIMLLVTRGIHDVFTGLEVYLSVGVDICDLCRIFRVQRYTKIKIYIRHDVIFVNEAHHVIKSNNLREIRITFWNKVDIRTHNRINTKPCRIESRVLAWYVVEHSFMH